MPSEEEEIKKLQAERKAALASGKKDKYAGYDTVLADEDPEEHDEPAPVRCVMPRTPARLFHRSQATRRA